MIINIVVARYNIVIIIKSSLQQLITTSAAEHNTELNKKNWQPFFAQKTTHGGNGTCHKLRAALLDRILMMMMAT
jgi:hypothetical protein